MCQTTAPGALVALSGLAARLGPGLAPAGPPAVAVAAVAAAAQDDLHAASRAQVQTGGLVHAHPGTTEVLDGLAPARHTAVAPPSSARCRARYGRRASRQERPLPRPPSSASTALYRGVPCATSGRTAGATATNRVPAMHARACLAALQGGQAGALLTQRRPEQLARFGRTSRTPKPPPHRRIEA